MAGRKVPSPLPKRIVSPPLLFFRVARASFPSPLKSAATVAWPGAGTAGSRAMATEFLGWLGTEPAWLAMAAQVNSASVQIRGEDFTKSLLKIAPIFFVHGL